MTFSAPCFATIDGHDVKLSELTVSGYQDLIGDEDWDSLADGVEDAITLTAINGSGGTLREDNHNRTYCWCDTAKKPAGWYDIDGNPMVSAEEAAKRGKTQSYWGDAEAITYTAGSGFRLQSSEDYMDNEEDNYVPFTLKFPSPIK